MIKTSKNLLILALLSLVDGKLFLSPSLSKQEDSYTSFIEKYLSPEPVTIVHDNTTEFNSVLRVNIPKILFNYDKPVNISLAVTRSNIFLLESPKYLTVALEQFTRLNNWNSRHPYLLIFAKDVTKKEIKESFSTLWRYNIYNVVTYYKGNKFYTWYPYRRESDCGGRINLVKVGQNNPYLNKIPKRVHGCTFKIAWTGDFLRNPFNKKSPGAQVLFMNRIGERMNLTIVYLPKDENYWEMLRHNKSLHPLIDDEKRRHVDAALSIRTWAVEVDDPENSAAFFQWTMQISPTNVLKSRPTRIIYLSFFVLIISLNTAYQSKMGSILTIPAFAPKIKSVEEFVLGTDIKLVSHSGGITLSDNQKMKNALANRIIRTKANLVSYVAEYLQNDSYAIVLDSLSITYIKDYEKLHIVKRSSYKNIFFTVATKKGYPLLETIDFWVEQMKEKGFDKKYSLEFIPFSNRTFVNESSRLVHQPLKLEHLQGAFHILIVGHGIAAIVFLLEILRSRH